MREECTCLSPLWGKKGGLYNAQEKVLLFAGGKEAAALLIKGETIRRKHDIFRSGKGEKPRRKSGEVEVGTKFRWGRGNKKGQPRQKKKGTPGGKKGRTMALDHPDRREWSYSSRGTSGDMKREKISFVEERERERATSFSREKGMHLQHFCTLGKIRSSHFPGEGKVGSARIEEGGKVPEI